MCIYPFYHPWRLSTEMFQSKVLYKFFLKKVNPEPTNTRYRKAEGKEKYA